MIQWFISATVRQASTLRKHVQKLLDHQRDILAPKAVEAVQAALAELRQALASKADKATLEKQMENLEQAANKWLKPYPNAAWRENVEVLLVALAVAMAIRTFFLQPFKIPTGSMEPTLFGVESVNLLRYPDVQIPTGWTRIRQWFQGISYLHVVADNDGTLGPVDPPVRLAIFNIKQTLYIGGQPYTIWFPPDYGSYGLEYRAELPLGQTVHKGDEIIKLRISAGDHLFVDRFTYNFRPPERGEIVVFETKGIPADRRDGPGWHIPPDQFYIKRLVGLGGERIQIGKDRHLIINGVELDARTPHFQNVYGFDPKEPPRPAHYSGHVFREDQLFFAEHHDDVAIPKDCFVVMGDNTMNSLDSRYWGYFPDSAVIGKAFFVYWPLTERFGWGYYR